MSDINQCVIHGRLTREPEIRFSPAGSPWAIFTLAANHKYTDRAGKVIEESAFVPCLVIGQAAAWARKSLKGEALIVSGRLKTQTWKKDASSHSRLVLVVDMVQFPGRTRAAAPPPNLGNGEQADLNPTGAQEELFARSSPAKAGNLEPDKIPF
jgi:single-strand DNA-binding protein